ncbi:hypothetical protein B0H13DRAFT_1898289 [Mycena leptocephala]|nr:hypothetical protein B0H13DRAFT_1898289 [Mycena leptocephala]
MPGTVKAGMNGESGTTKPDQCDPSYHLDALSPHDDTDSNSNSPILPPVIALSSTAGPKPSFVHGPKPSIPKVEDVSIWLRWAVHPASALHVLLLPPLLALPTHFLLLLRPYLPPPSNLSETPSLPFFLLSHPTPAPSRLSAAAEWGIRKAEKVARFGERGCGCVLFGGGGLGGVHTLHTPASSALNPTTAHFWIDYSHNHLSGPMKRYYLSQIAYWLQQALARTCVLASIHWRASTSAWNADAGVAAASCSPAKSCFVSRAWGIPDSRAQSRLSLGAPSFPEPGRCGAVTNRFAGRYSGHADSGVPDVDAGIDMRALHGPGHVCAQRPWIGIGNRYRHPFLRLRR